MYNVSCNHIFFMQVIYCIFVKMDNVSHNVLTLTLHFRCDNQTIACIFTFNSPIIQEMEGQVESIALWYNSIMCRVCLLYTVLGFLNICILFIKSIICTAAIVKSVWQYENVTFTYTRMSCVVLLFHILTVSDETKVQVVFLPCKQ